MHGHISLILPLLNQKQGQIWMVLFCVFGNRICLISQGLIVSHPGRWDLKY